MYYTIHVVLSFLLFRRTACFIVSTHHKAFVVDPASCVCVRLTLKEGCERGREMEREIERERQTDREAHGRSIMA